MVGMRAGLTIVVLALAACAPWAPAPVEERGNPAPGRSQPRVVAPPPAVYEVRRGDTLYSIAFRHDLDWKEVAQWNGIEAPYTIRPGQELRLTRPVRRGAASGAPNRSDSARERRPAPSRPAAEREPEQATQNEPPSESRQGTVPEPTSRPEPAPGASSNTRSAGGVEWQWPTEGRVEHAYDPSATRRGIGIAGRAGQPVHAAASGEVVYSGTALIGYGELIILKHSEELLSAYGFNRNRRVKEGDRVRRGEQIAEMGRSEREAEMLHFEVRRKGQPVNPLDFLPSR